MVLLGLGTLLIVMAVITESVIRIADFIEGEKKYV